MNAPSLTPTRPGIVMPRACTNCGGALERQVEPFEDSFEWVCLACGRSATVQRREPTESEREGDQVAVMADGSIRRRRANGPRTGKVVL